MVECDAAPPGLAQRLSDMHAQVTAVERDDELDLDLRHTALVVQLHTLADFIETARREVAAVGADDIVRRQVPAATDELDAILLHTAEATGLILDQCEALEAAVLTSPLRMTVTRATARIYEACSFQDITGQRVAKVVHALKTIEAKVGDMVRVFGCTSPVAVAQPHPIALLNGPQRSGHAMEQPEIDALLASFE